MVRDERLPDWGRSFVLSWCKADVVVALVFLFFANIPAFDCEWPSRQFKPKEVSLNCAASAADAPPCPTAFAASTAATCWKLSIPDGRRKAQQDCTRPS